MVGFYLSRKGGFYNFPFWLGIISLGWFYPQAIGGYTQVEQFPAGAYFSGMLFASLCLLGVWFGYWRAAGKDGSNTSWLTAQFDVRRLYYAGAFLCLFGFYFEFKLRSLPDEILSMTQWTGAAVKYLFLSNVFHFGLVALWLIYLSQRKLFALRLFVFLVPCFLLLFDAAIFGGRRAVMMNLVSYITVGLWFVRRLAVPRWLILLGVSVGLLLINAIGVYRAIMEDKETPLTERISEVSKVDYTATSSELLKKSGAEFENYTYYRLVIAEDSLYDYGLAHWNRLVFNFVPAQIVGGTIKELLMIDLPGDPKRVAMSRYGHSFKTGTTGTGFRDAFESFGWFGFIKFIMIGWIMGTLYRYGMKGCFLGQLLYIYLISPGMHAISHETNRVLVSSWVYFFALGYPVFYWAKVRKSNAGLADLSHAESAT